MKQEVRHPAPGAEFAVARDRAISDQKTVEIIAYRGGETLLGGPVGASAAAQNHCITTQLLVQQCDGPAAHHPVALRGIDRLEGIVPVAVAIADEVCAGDEALANRGDQLPDMSRDRVCRSGPFEV